MDTTDCLGLPFPECDPPLTKDASDIAQFKALADATDAAVQTLADRIAEFVTAPDAVSIQGGDNQAGQVTTHLYNGSVNFDNSSMADTVADVIRIQSDGWYLIGGTVFATPPAAAILALRVEPLLNGDPFTARQGNGFSVSPGVLYPDAVSWIDTVFLRMGDALSLMTQHTDNPATVMTYGYTGWAIRILGNV